MDLTDCIAVYFQTFYKYNTLTVNYHEHDNVITRVEIIKICSESCIRAASRKSLMPASLPVIIYHRPIYLHFSVHVKQRQHTGIILSETCCEDIDTGRSETCSELDVFKCFEFQEEDP